MNAADTPRPASPLIQASELHAALSGPDAGSWLVLDCRFQLAHPQAGEAAYQQGHIPDAVYAHLDRDLSGAKDGRNGRHPLPEAPRFIDGLRQWGLTPTTRVVAYDDAGGMFAARAWWMLRHWLGHPWVQVLDGGWQAWLALAHATATTDGGPASWVEDTLPPPRPLGHTSHLAADAAQVLSCDEVLAHLGHPETMRLLDARAPDRFRGDNETLDPVGGHIPGAMNRFFQLNLDTDGRLKPAAQLKGEFDQLLGGAAPGTVVHQCGSGVTACHNLLAMEVAGLTGARLFAGSWSAWCADPARPMTR